MSQLARNDNFKLNLKLAMEARHLSNASLAKLVGKDKTTVGRWAKGDNVPGPSVIAELEEKLSVRGLPLPHAQFAAENSLRRSYSDIEYIPIITDNENGLGLFEKRLFQCLDDAEVSVHYTVLCEFDQQDDESDRRAYPHLIPREFQHQPFLKKMFDRRLRWERVEVFFSVDRLVAALRSLRQLQGTQYDIRFYRKPPKSVPTINLRSFDHEKFILGGYDPKIVYRSNCLIIPARDPLADFLRNYWTAVWEIGTPERLTFTTSDVIAGDLGVSKGEWRDMKEAIRAKTKPLNPKVKD